jgi:hypothetical protein
LEQGENTARRNNDAAVVWLADTFEGRESRNQGGIIGVMLDADA